MPNFLLEAERSLQRSSKNPAQHQRVSLDSVLLCTTVDISRCTLRKSAGSLDCGRFFETVPGVQQSGFTFPTFSLLRAVPYESLESCSDSRERLLPGFADSRCLSTARTAAGSTRQNMVRALFFVDSSSSARVWACKAGHWFHRSPGTAVSPKQRVGMLAVIDT